MFPPGAVISGLKSRFGVGPHEVKSLIRPEFGFGVSTLSPSNDTVTVFPASISAFIASPSACNVDMYGILIAASEAMLIVPVVLLYTITPAAPAACAFKPFSTKAISPREIRANLPVKSFPSKSAGLPKPANSTSYEAFGNSIGSASFARRYITCPASSPFTW